MIWHIRGMLGGGKYHHHHCNQSLFSFQYIEGVDTGMYWGGKGRHNVSGTESNHLGHWNSQQCHKHFLQNSTFCSWKHLRFEHGGDKLVSCPGHHLASVHPCMDSCSLWWNWTWNAEELNRENFLANSCVSSGLAVWKVDKLEWSSREMLKNWTERSF